MKIKINFLPSSRFPCNNRMLGSTFNFMMFSSSKWSLIINQQSLGFSTFIHLFKVQELLIFVDSNWLKLLIFVFWLIEIVDICVPIDWNYWYLYSNYCFQPLPELDRIPGLKLPGKAFADCLMVLEFAHNFSQSLKLGQFDG